MAERSLSLCKNPACLGLGFDWSECCGKSESECEPTTTKRFKFVDDNNLQELSKGFARKNTAMSTKWAPKNLQAWKDARNSKFLNDPVPEDLLKTTDESVLCLWLSRYAVETRKTTGELYPPATIYQLLSALLSPMLLHPLLPACSHVLLERLVYASSSSHENRQLPMH